jgi:hypothetical protein
MAKQPTRRNALAFQHMQTMKKRATVFIRQETPTSESDSSSLLTEVEDSGTRPAKAVKNKVLNHPDIQKAM